MRRVHERGIPCVPIAFVLEQITAEAPRDVDAHRIVVDEGGADLYGDESQF